MGLNGSSVNGMLAIDNCAPSGCSANGCGAGCSTSSGYYLSYAHHLVCGGSTKCTKQTGLPIGFGCGASYGLQNFCTGVILSATLFECGPDPRNVSQGYCINSSSPLVGCVTSRTFAALCGGCNPLNYGLIQATLT